jgi:tetratricopeptide (TPR) repeat protein
VGSAGRQAEAQASANLDESLVRKARRLLARKAYPEVIDLLDIHRPAEWAVVDLEEMRLLRVLGQAYRGKGDLLNAADCLEQLRLLQKEQALLPRQEYLAALTDLRKCWLELGQAEQAEDCRQEMKKLSLLSR